MEVNQIFNQQHIIFWAVFVLVVLGQAMTVGRPVRATWRRWPEQRRFWLGYVTLFGGTSYMVLLAGWDADTWLWLAAAVWFSRVIVELSPLAALWKRREAYRWATAWLAAFVAAIPLTADFLTHTLMFITLGIAGLVKVGWEGAIDSWRARELRRRKVDGSSTG